MGGEHVALLHGSKVSVVVWLEGERVVLLIVLICC